MREDFWFDSCGAGRIHVCRWMPEGEPKALAHLYLRIWIDLQNTISHNLYLIFSDCLSRCYNLTVDVS